MCLHINCNIVRICHQQLNHFNVEQDCNRCRILLGPHSTTPTRYNFYLFIILFCFPFYPFTASYPVKWDASSGSLSKIVLKNTMFCFLWPNLQNESCFHLLLVPCVTTFIYLFIYLFIYSIILSTFLHIHKQPSHRWQDLE